MNNKIIIISFYFISIIIQFSCKKNTEISFKGIKEIRVQNENDLEVAVLSDSNSIEEFIKKSFKNVKKIPLKFRKHITLLLIGSDTTSLYVNEDAFVYNTYTYLSTNNIEEHINSVFPIKSNQ